jgi:hypothetical protein
MEEFEQEKVLSFKQNAEKQRQKIKQMKESQAILEGEPAKS